MTMHLGIGHCDTTHLSVTPVAFTDVCLNAVAYPFVAKLTQLADPASAAIYVISNMTVRFLLENYASREPLSCPDQAATKWLIAGAALGCGCIAAHMGEKWIASKFSVKNVEKFSVKKVIDLGIISILAQFALAFPWQSNGNRILH